MAKFKDTHFVVQRITDPQNKRFGAQETCKRLLINPYVLLYKKYFHLFTFYHFFYSSQDELEQ